MALGFFFLAVTAFIKAQPESRDKRVYAELKPYIPYKIEKKMSRLRIVNTKTGEKFEPSNLDIYHVLDNLEKDWGEKHLRREGDLLVVFDDKNQTLKKIPLRDESAKAYVQHFFGL